MLVKIVNKKNKNVELIEAIVVNYDKNNIAIEIKLNGDDFSVYRDFKDYDIYINDKHITHNKGKKI